MRIRKSLLLLISFILIVFIIFFTLKPASVTVSTQRFARNFLKELKQDRDFFNEHTEGIYRIYAYGDSLCYLTEKGIFFSDLNLSVERELASLPSKGSLFYLRVAGDSLIYLNYDTKTLHIDYRNTHIIDTIRGVANNCIFQGGKFFFDIAIKDERDERKNEFLIQSTIPSSGKMQKVIDFRELTNKQTGKFKDCLEYTFDGNFFDIGEGKWIFLFYKAGYFIYYDGFNYQLYQTIDKKPFREYELRKVKVGDIDAYMCHSDDETTANFAAGADEENIYILSGTSLITKDTGWHCSIDVYDKKKGEYKHSFFIPLKSKKNFATNLVVYKNWLYLHINGMGLRRYKIK